MRHSLAILIAVVIVVLTLPNVVAQKADQADVQLKAAIKKEVVDGDLKAAIAEFQRIVNTPGVSRAVAASALVHLGQCHEKLGNAEAQKSYARVLKEYADQTEAAGYARARLAAMRQASPERAEPTIQARRILAGPYGDAVDYSGGPTPDGRSLVYVDTTGKNLAVRNLETGASRLITNRGSEKGYMVYSEIVSPDGRRVAYAWQPQASPEQPSARMELRVVGMDGSGDRILRGERSIYPGSWSRDGRHIAAEISRGEDADTEIAWISVDDGSKISLATFRYGAGIGPRLSHSPDDRFVAVDFPVEKDSARGDICLLSTKGGSVLPLVDHPGDDRLIGWMPGTDDVLFTSDRSGNRDLWGIRVGADGRPGEPRPVRRGIGEMDAMGFTQDGSLFYSVYTLQYNIFVAPFDESSGQVKVNEAKPLGGRGSNNRPSWSPNGEHLAFVRRRPAPPGRGSGMEEILHVLNTKTGEERSLVEHIAPATTGGPTWFPDGRSLLLLGMPQTEMNRGKVPSVAYRIDLASGGATRLFQFPPDENWWFRIGLFASPSGDGVIFNDNGRLVLHHLQSAKEEELYSDPDLGGVHLSPDGSELVFKIKGPAVADWRTQVPQQGTRLMIIGSRGGEARELVRVERPWQEVSIVGSTSEGRYLLFVQMDEKGAAVMRVPWKGGKAERLSETREMLRGLSLSPDGRRVAYWTRENEAEIWVMENIKEALARAR